MSSSINSRNSLQNAEPFTSSAQAGSLSLIAGASHGFSRIPAPTGFANNQPSHQLHWSSTIFQPPPGYINSEQGDVSGLGISPIANKPVNSDPRIISRQEEVQGTASRDSSSPSQPLERESLGRPTIRAIDDASFPALPKVPVASRSKEFSKESLASDVNLPSKSSKQGFDEANPSRNNTKSPAPQPQKESKTSEDASKRHHPGKIDTSTAANILSTVPQELSSAALAYESRITPVQTLRDTSDSPSSTSLPATPGTASETPVKKITQPRTIRVLATPNVGAPASAPARAQTPSTTPLTRTASPATKAPSRKPSIGSINFPSTPASEKVSDNASVTTDSISRASSPQPSKSGSAATKLKKKSQRNKERHELPKNSNELSAQEERRSRELNQPVLEESIVHEPIVGRKKKNKKPVIVSTTTNTSTPGTSRPGSPGPRRDDNESQEPTRSSSPMSSQPKEAAESTEPQMEAIPKPTPTVASEQQKTQPFPASILAGLFASGDINTALTEFFKTAGGFNHPRDITVTDLANLLPSYRIKDDEFARLDAGEPVRHHEGGETRARTLLTPYRRTLVRGLPREMEDFFMGLENRVANIKPPIKYSHRRSTPAGDENSTAAAGARIAERILKDEKNLLCRPANTSNIVDPTKRYGDETLSYLNQFILPPLPPREESDDATPSIGSAIPRIYTTGDPTYSVYGAEVSLADKVGSFTGNPLDDISGPQPPAMKQVLVSTMGAVGVLGAEEAEQAMLSSRKECEALEKRLLGLIKKNKRLAFGTGQ